jgi:heme exporter protein A
MTTSLRSTAAPPAAPTPGGLPTLQLDRVACARGGRAVCRGLSFTLEAGGLVWLRGPNGSGKTTLLRVVAGLAPPAAGCLRWGGEPLPDSAGYRRSRVYLGHANGLRDDQTADEALEFACDLQGLATSVDVRRQALARLDLSGHADAPVRTLSQGQRRRVALARLLLQRVPALWILDEPFEALDAAGVGELNQALTAHRRRGGSVLMTSHLPIDGPDGGPDRPQVVELASQALPAHAAAGAPNPAAHPASTPVSTTAGASA